MKYLIIGGGALARHLECYFSQLGLSFSTWNRKDHSEADLHNKIQDSENLLLAISDSEIEDFYLKYCASNSKMSIHFSGSLSVSGMYSAHPLMSFGPGTYSLSEYEKIPFITERSLPKFTEVFPELKNPHYAIESSQKPLYHALVALMINVPQILLSQASEVLTKETRLPREVLLPILKKSLENFVLYGKKSVTGAIVRGDTRVVNKHLEQLKAFSFDEIYAAAAKIYLKSSSKSNSTPYGDSHVDSTL